MAMTLQEFEAWRASIDAKMAEYEYRLKALEERVTAMDGSIAGTGVRPGKKSAASKDDTGGFPRTDTDLAARGYEFQNKGTCKGCHADIEWWSTPRGKKIPLDAGTLEPHWNNCPNANDFRGGN